MKVTTSATSASDRRAKPGMAKARHGPSAVTAMRAPASTMRMSEAESSGSTAELPAKAGKMAGAPLPSARWQPWQYST